MGFRLLPSKCNKHLLLLLFSLHSIGLKGGGEEIKFTSTEIFENSAIGSRVGSFDVINPDQNESYQFQLLQVTPSWGESSFELESNGTLLTARSLDYESSPEYSITIGLESSSGGNFVRSFDVSVTNEAEIIDLILSNNRLPENEQNSSVGFFTAITDDNNQDANLSYEIVHDDGNFSIIGDRLVALSEFDYEQTQQQTLQLQVSATGYQSLEKNFSIEIDDKYENQAPSDLKFFSVGIYENEPAGEFLGTLLGIDSDQYEILTYSLGGNAIHSDVNVSLDGSVFVNRSFDFEANETSSFSAKVRDSNGRFFEKEFPFEVLDDVTDNNQSLEPLGGVSGRVVGEDGEPIEYFEILAYDANDTSSNPLPVQTKLIVHEDGDYDLKIMPGRYHLLITGAYRSHPSYQAFKPDSFEDGEIEISKDSLHLTRKNWVLKPMELLSGVSDRLLEVNGTVVDDAGNPLEGIAIEVKDWEVASFKYPIATAVTGNQGRFAMHLQPGSYHFRAIDFEGKWMQRPTDDEEIRVTKGIPIEDLDFELERRSQMTVSGSLMTVQAVAADAKLSFWDREQETLVQPLGGVLNPTGRYSYELPLGKYLVKATDPEGVFMDSWYGGKSLTHARVVEGDSNGSRIENIDLVMLEQPSVELLITYKIGEHPVSRPPILEVTHEDSSELDGEDSFFPVGEATNVPGQFSYRMKSESVRLSLLPLFPSKPVSKVESEDLGRKKLSYNPQDGVWSLNTGGLSKLGFHPVREKFDLTLDLSRFDEFIQGSSHEQLDTNDTGSAPLSLSSSTVSGSVLTMDGSLVANAKVEARNRDTGIIHVCGTDGSGHFVFDELSAGKWSFIASPPDGVSYRLMANSNLYELEIVASTKYPLRIFLKPANIIGQVTFVDGNGMYQKAELGWCWVVPKENQTSTDLDESSQGFYMNLNQDGRFGMHLPQGKYELTIEVFSQSGQSRQKNFSIQVLNPNKVMVLGERFPISWPKVEGASEYHVQKESHFIGHYETLETFEGNQSSGSFISDVVSDYNQKYRVLAKAKHKYNSMSLVEKYLSIKPIAPIGILKQDLGADDSNSSGEGMPESVHVYALNSFDLEQLSGDQNLTKGDYSILERFDDTNRSLGVFIEPVEEILNKDFSTDPLTEYAISSNPNDSIPTDRTYYEDRLLFEPDVRIGFPLIEFPITEFEISGVVYDQNGTLLSGVEVLAFDLWNGTLLRTVSGDTGRYSLSVGPGSWEIEVGSTTDVLRLDKDGSSPLSDFEIPTVPVTGKVMVNVNATESVGSVDFMVNLEAETILVLGQFELLSSSAPLDLQGYEAEVRLVSQSGEFITQVEDNGSFSLSIPNGFYEVYPWLDSRSGIYPEYESSNQKTGVFDSYEISSPYFSMSIPSDSNSTIEPMVIHLGQADSRLQGFVKDLDGLPIPGAVVTALSDLGELLIAESDYLGSFQFSVRGNAYWTIQCDFIYSDPLDGNRYQTPEYQRYWLNNNEQRNLEFVASKSKNQIKGSVDVGSVASSSYFRKEVYLKKTDLWGNETIVAKSLIDAQGDFAFLVPEGEQLLGQLDSSLTVGVLADWTGALPTLEPLEIKDYPFSVGSNEVVLSDSLSEIKSYSVDGQFFRNGLYEAAGWVGEVFALSMASQSDQRVESDMRVTNVAEDGAFSLSLPPGVWSIDYRITRAAGQIGGFDFSLPDPLFISVGTSSNSLEPFDLITDSSASAEHSLKITLASPSKENIMGLCHLDLVPHNTGQGKRTFSTDRTTLRLSEGVIEHNLATEGMYDLWVFPGPQLREEGYYMPEPFVAWVNGPATEVTITIPQGDKNLDLSAELSGQVLGLDGEPVILEDNNFYQAPIVWITSSTGLFSWAYCDWDGSFGFREIPQNLEWYAGSSYFDPFLGKDLATLSDQGPFQSGADGIVLQLDDFSGATPMPQETSEFFDPWSNFQKIMPDGLEILIPKGAIPVEPNQRTVRIVVSPNLSRLPRDLLSVPVGYGYELRLFDEKGKLIEGQFRKKVKLSIPVNAFFLEGMNLELSDIEVAYFDHTFNSWRSQPNQVLEAEAQTIHLLVDHFSTWVSIANAGTHVPVPVPLGESAKAIGETFWYKHDWFGEFYAMPNSNWIFHSVHGWLYIEQPNENEIWAFDSKLNDWLWTNSGNYSDGRKHFFFSNKWKSYLWHSPETTNPRWLFDYERNAWFTDEMSFSVNVEVINSSYGTVVGEGVYARGESPKLIANPKYGYSFDGWSGGDSSTESEIELPALNRATTLQARFSKIPPLSVGVVNLGQGVGKVEGADSYDYGNPVLLKAVAGERSIFMGWLDEKGEKLSWEEEYIINELIEKRSLKALFEPATIENILLKRYEQ